MNLRRQAEERLQANTERVHPPRTEHEAGKLVHELAVHQVELEMRNAELRLTQDELEATVSERTVS